MVGQSEGAAGGSKSRLFGLGALYRIGVVAVLSSKQKKKKRERETGSRILRNNGFRDID